MWDRLLKTLRKSGDFQAEYEGSIPFTRSKSNFNNLARILDLIPATVKVISATRLNTFPILPMFSLLRIKIFVSKTLCVISADWIGRARRSRRHAR